MIGKYLIAAFVLAVSFFLPLTAQAETSQSLNLTVGKAEIYQLPRHAAEILVSDPNIADVNLPTPDRLYLLGRGLGDANIFAFDASGNVIARLEVHVSIDDERLKKVFKELLPNEKINVETLNQDLVLTGQVSNPAIALKAKTIARRFVADDVNLVDMISVTGQQQVMLKVRILEVNKTALKELGTELSIGPDGFGDFIGELTTSALGLSTAPALNGSLVFSPNGSGPFGIGLSLLERDGLARTLAEPNLTAVSGESASFLAGGEYPIPVAQDGTGAITIEFRRFGVSLAFTPVVLDDDRISLRLGTEVSSLSNEVEVELSSTRIQGLNIRRAETTVEIGSGGSMMIGGLLQSEIIDTVNGVPGLMHAPVIGQLFRSDSFARNESELIVLVTPYLVEPYAEAHAEINRVKYVEDPVDFHLADELSDLYGGVADLSHKAQGVGYIIE